MSDAANRRLVKDVATLKAIADPIRMAVLELAMAEPSRTWTAKELAGKVGVPPTKIYYHLNLLEQHRLLQVRDTRVVNGIIEKHYGAGQRDLTFRRSGPETAGGVGDVVANLLRQTSDEIEQGLASGTISAGIDAPDRERMLLSRAVADIPEALLADFRDELLALVQRFEKAGAGKGARFAVLVALHPAGGGRRGRRAAAVDPAGGTTSVG